MNNKIYFIVAGNFREYEKFVNRKLEEFPNLGSWNFKFVRDSHSILGVDRISGFYVGTFRNRPDIIQLQNLIKSRRIL